MIFGWFIVQHATIKKKQKQQLTTVLSPWDFFHENSGWLPLGKLDATESRYPTYGACWVFQFFHNPPNSDMDYRIFNVRTDVNTCECTRKCGNTVRESALKLGEKPLPHQGIEPESAACRSDSLPTELHPHNGICHYAYIHIYIKTVSFRFFHFDFL